MLVMTAGGDLEDINKKEKSSRAYILSSLPERGKIRVDFLVMGGGGSAAAAAYCYCSSNQGCAADDD